MIVERGSYKLEAFLRKLAKHLTLDDKVQWSAGDEVYYLGGGYWRAKPIYNGEGEDAIMTGVRLINPDRTPEEINVIATAMTILV